MIPYYFDQPFHAPLPAVPVQARPHVTAPNGPAEVVCNECGLLMFPWEEITTVRGYAGVSEWVCFPCYRGVLVSWSIEA